MVVATLIAESKPVAVSIDEAAQALRVSGKTVRRLMARGVLPATRVSMRWRVHVEGIEKLLNGQSAQPSVADAA
jgi:excisionase family DNA binding protein